MESDEECQTLGPPGPGRVRGERGAESPDLDAIEFVLSRLSGVGAPRPNRDLMSLTPELAGQEPGLNFTPPNDRKVLGRKDQ